MHCRVFIVWCALIASVSVHHNLSAQDGLRYVAPAESMSQAVVVTRQALIHTRQFVDPKAAAHSGDAAQQIAAALAELQNVLKSHDASLDRLVRLNVYVKSDAVAEQMRQSLTQHVGQGRPAVTFVRGELTKSEQLVAVDGIAAGKQNANAWQPPQIDRDAAIMYPGRIMYIAGQAEKADTLREATRLTMESLRKTLALYGGTLDHAVHVKSFMLPISQQADVDDEVVKFFGSHKAAPQSFVEWSSNLPIEIELIASLPPQDGPVIEYLTPPGLTASPVFSRVAIINSPTVIYTAGLISRVSGNGEAQVRSVFAQLQELTAATQSDLKHLAKATYYVADNDVSTMLNKIRPEYYDPARPPSASKALVAGVGRESRTLTIDMIAVPARRP